MCTGIMSLSLMNYLRRWLFQYLSKKYLNVSYWNIQFLNRLSSQIINKVFQVKFSGPHFLRDKNELYSRNPKTVTYKTDSVSFLTPKMWSIVSQGMKNYKYLYKKYKEMETKLPISVMFNLIATCCFFLIKMCHTGIKTYLFCYLFVM